MPGPLLAPGGARAMSLGRACCACCWAPKAAVGLSPAVGPRSRCASSQAALACGAQAIWPPTRSGAWPNLPAAFRPLFRRLALLQHGPGAPRSAAGAARPQGGLMGPRCAVGVLSRRLPERLQPGRRGCGAARPPGAGAAPCRLQGRRAQVVSAPTGAGKTVVLELCVLRLLQPFLQPDASFSAARRPAQGTVPGPQPGPRAGAPGRLLALEWPHGCGAHGAPARRSAPRTGASAWAAASAWTARSCRGTRRTWTWTRLRRPTWSAPRLRSLVRPRACCAAHGPP